MLWIIAASVLVGLVLGTCVGVLVMSLIVASGQANEPIPVHMDDWA